MTRGRTAALVAGGAAGAAVWTALASAVFLIGTGLVRHYPAPVWQWWLYLPYAGENADVRRWLAIGAAVATAGLGGAGLAWTRRAANGPRLRPALDGRSRGPVRGGTDNHGHADWMPMAQARALFPGPHPEHGGVVVGEAYRVDEDRVARVRFDPADRATWGQGGRARLLIDPCTDGPTHSLVVAGSGAFKTASAVSTLLHWTGSAVVLDPSCELGPMLRDAREAMGHAVATLDPDRPGPGFNVLDWIDPGRRGAEVNVRAVVGWICEDTSARPQAGNGEFFRNMGRDLVACLLANLLWDPDLPAADKTLRTLRAGLVTPVDELRQVLAEVHAASPSLLARQLAGSLKDIVDETFSGIYASAIEATSWLSVPAYAELVSDPAFRAADVTRGRLTVFVQVPLKTLQATPAVARVLIGALLNAAYDADGDVRGRILFLLDEAARLGRMGILETARDAGRKYRITLQLLYQSNGQIEAQWGREGRAAWEASVSWRCYAAVQDMPTAREVSEACGSFGVLASSEGDNRGRSGQTGKGTSRSSGRSTSVHEVKRALVTPAELTQDMRTDEAIVLARGARPLRCGRAIYFRRPEMRDRVEASRFHTEKDAG